MNDTAKDFLEAKLKTEYPNDYLSIIKGYNKHRLPSIRINTLVTGINEVKAILKENNISFKEVSYFPNALIITNAKEDTLEALDIYNEGKIYLQSLSSMLPPLFLEARENDCILDMAAAPGGKTTEIAILTNNKGLITAVEKNKIRAERLKYNITKQHAKNVNVIVSDALKLDSFFTFQRILLDAPCSGSGTVSYLVENKKQSFSEKLLKEITDIQRKLLAKAIKHLQKNEIMVYSTCSVFKEENEDALRSLLKAKEIELLPLDSNITSNLPLLPSNLANVITVMPNELYEGFFVAKIKKIK